MKSKRLYGGLVVAISVGLAGCPSDSTPIDTTTGGSSSGSSTGDPSTGNASTPPTTDAPTTGTSSDTSSTSEPVTGSSTSDATTGTPGSTSTTDGTTDGTGSSTTGVDLCADGVLNQDETDIDCGGLTCGGCAEGQVCIDTPDCAVGVCIAGVCAVGACDDGVQNLDETDIDCGGASCPACAIGQVCVANSDCAEGACIEGVCTAVECLSDADCDGQDSECSDASCALDTYTCVSAPANDGADCDDGDLCSTTSTCSAGACTAGELVDCSALDGICVVGACNPDDGQCQAVPGNEGAACDDNNACTAASVCTAGACGDPKKLGYVLNEDFSDNSAGWTLDNNWAIGPAVAGCGDPATDHTPTADNGVAGVVLGGCSPTAVSDYFCLTSPVLDTTGMAKVFVNFWRDLWSDYTPYMKNKIEVWNGNAWVIVFETFGAPEVNDAAWTKFSYDVSAQSNAALRVRWCTNVGAGAFNRGSWNVDDVVIAETAVCAP